MPQQDERVSGPGRLGSADREGQLVASLSSGGGGSPGEEAPCYALWSGAIELTADWIEAYAQGCARYVGVSGEARRAEGWAVVVAVGQCCLSDHGGYR